MGNKTHQRKHSPKGTASPIEAVKDLGRDLVDGATKDLVGGIASDALRQVMGPSPEAGHEQERILPERKEPQPFFSVKERALYVEENKREIAYKANLILTEIKELAKQTDGLDKQLDDFAMEEMPDDPGEYHLSFLERVLKLVQKARQAIHDAATWFAVWNARRQKKGLLAGYGHGRGRKSTTAAIHKMLGGEMGAARSGA